MELAAGIGEVKGEVGLVVRPWRQTVSVLDVWRLAGECVNGGISNWIERSLACSIVVELAAYDLPLAKFLASLSLKELCSPEAPLKEFASFSERTKWMQEAAWEFGSVDEWRGGRLVHSSWLAIRDRQKEIARRVWQGQLSVMYPYLERCRVHLLPKWTSQLSLPVMTPGGAINDIESLELGQLAYHLRGRLSNEEFRCLAKLRNWRHELAHLRPITNPDVSDLPIV